MQPFIVSPVPFELIAITIIVVITELEHSRHHHWLMLPTIAIQVIASVIVHLLAAGPYLLQVIITFLIN
jgi:hypothetical protein